MLFILLEMPHNRNLIRFLREAYHETFSFVIAHERVDTSIFDHNCVGCALKRHITIKLMACMCVHIDDHSIGQELVFEGTSHDEELRTIQGAEGGQCPWRQGFNNEYLP